MAFNLGVWMRHTEGEKSIFEIGKKIEEIIYWNIFQKYGGLYPEEFIHANVDYFLHIALLGYIVPKVCPPDEEFKNRLISLLHAKIVKQVESGSFST
jgi:hypothetical protein